MKSVLNLVVLSSAILVTACGGGSSATADNDESPDNYFPSGVAIASPTAVTTSTTATASLSVPRDVPFTTKLADWSHSMREAIAGRDSRRMQALVFAALPFGKAYAAPVARPEFSNLTDFLDEIRAGTAAPTAANVSWNDFFQSSGNANCYGPTLLYAGHDDGAPANGTLPSGDLGMWTTYEAPATPCSAAQLNRLVSSSKKKGNASLILGASMVYVANANSLLPAAGTTVDITTPYDTFIKTIDPAVTVEAATIERSSADTWTYTLAANKGTGAAAQSIVIKLTHTPGASSGMFSGLLQYAAMSLGSDAAFGCTDQQDGALFKVASVGSLRYEKTSSTEAAFGSRESRYCGHTSSSTSTDLTEVASFDANGELDPTVTVPSTGIRGATTGWRGDFRRFGAEFDPSTYEGNFLFAWQAGTLDDMSRMFAANMTYDSSTETRTGKAFFGFADPVDTTTGDMLGMICNWAGPGNTHTPVDQFQHQQISLSASGSEWTLSTPLSTYNKIRYAPTNNCNSTGAMTYDEDLSGTITAGEGSSTSNELDGLTGGRTTVASELAARGFAKPSIF